MSGVARENPGDTAASVFRLVLALQARGPVTFDSGRGSPIAFCSEAVSAAVVRAEAARA